MPQSVSSYIISSIVNSIPREILELALKPRVFNTNIESRIISEIIEGSVLLDTNLVGGKRRIIFIEPYWELDLPNDTSYSFIGSGVQGSYYKIPPEARENRNISSVIGLVPSMVSGMPGSNMNYNGGGGFGNTATGMLSEMLNTRTFAQYPMMPQATLEGTNIIMFYPKQMVYGAAVSVMLEYDSEFLNMNQSSIFAMRNFCLCATYRYIANKLKVSIDETEIVGGMEIGVVKELVNSYADKAERYDELLMKLKGAMAYDSKTLTRLIYHAL